MGILNRLWREVWEAEQRSKDQIADKVFADQVKDAELSRQTYKAVPTRLQTYAEQHGASREPPVFFGSGVSNQMTNTQQNLTKLYQQALMQSMQQNTVSQQAHLNTYQPQNNLLAGAGGGRYAHTYPTPSQHTYTTGGGVPSTGYTGVAGTMIYRHLGNLTRDTLFLALKGVEEAAMKVPKGNHPYDDQAIKLLDMRNFNGESVDMLQLCSFCVSNCYEPEPLIKLLEGSGIEVKA